MTKAESKWTDAQMSEVLAEIRELREQVAAIKAAIKSFIAADQLHDERTAEYQIDTTNKNADAVGEASLLKSDALERLSELLVFTH